MRKDAANCNYWKAKGFLLRESCELPHEDETKMCAASCYWNKHKFISDAGFHQISAAQLSISKKIGTEQKLHNV